ncbi:MAG: hypothetical protein WBP31_07045 [Chitinophagales bacterium]|jgi:hypothetical protein|nr:hypothetical protein [Bacteroidota bacterium]MBK9555199.1 hypothetical protein [Bacteroidota bacterium]MBL0279522.1 hypothetical protein [Bacteroidota bacterium]MBP9879127.1 hypothetical protein [Chitinophagales bacterium]
MRYGLVLMLASLVFISCNKKKYERVTSYNDKVVSYIEQSERTMKVWNTTNFMQEYTIKKQNSVTRLLNMQDSLNNLTPLEDDDTLRLAGLSMIENYLNAFAIFDTVHKMLSDSLFLKEDSIRVQELLRSNQNMLKQQAESFMETQKRFSTRYELPFLE